MASVGDQAVRLPRHCLARATGLLREVRCSESTSPLAVESIFSEIIAGARANAPVPGNFDKLQRVLDCLESDAGTVPSIRHLAEIADFHPVRLAPTFRKRFGLSPSDYIRKRRVHKAVSLIAQRRSLVDAASSLGFVDQSHLHRSFVAEFRMTPRAFRRLALGRADVSRIQNAGSRRW